MSKQKLMDVRALLEFAPIDARYQELQDLYIADFGEIEGLETFVMNCGGVDAALEVLHVCQVGK